MSLQKMFKCLLQLDSVPSNSLVRMPTLQCFFWMAAVVASSPAAAAARTSPFAGSASLLWQPQLAFSAEKRHLGAGEEDSGTSRRRADGGAEGLQLEVVPLPGEGYLQQQKHRRGDPLVHLLYAEILR